LATCSQMLQEKEGIGSDEVTWIQNFKTDAFWMRDFGPFFVSDTNDETLSIVDAKYYPGRPNDDAQPEDFALRYEYPLEKLDLYYEGGNFLPNGNGLCIASSVLLDANPHYEKEIPEMMRDYLGCENLVVVQALDDAATGHVDMWLAWADPTTLLVGEYTEQQDKRNHDIIEKNVTDLLSGMTDPVSGDEIQLIRVPMPSNCPPAAHNTGKGDIKIPKKAAPRCGNLASDKRVWRTYLNVTFINDTVIVPVYLQDTTYEAEAIRIWEDQKFNVRKVVSDHIAPYQGEIHCITKTVPAAL
ncbi:MAG: agmatine deiminase family protein, partial [Gammaproteobacteria bacterium]|nr:agmatine deiminase family protein [Gammaproteobacteria bacterium]